MSVDSYLGISKTYLAEYKQSGSKFIGFLFPSENAKSFEQRIKELKTEYADATHVCSACILGVERDYQKFSDDGEPSNSAGRPILHALLSKNISFVGCAVVRYYGGKKLGIPGLIEAYGATAELCLESAELKSMVLYTTIKCKVSPSKSYLLYNFLSKLPSIHYHTADDFFILSFPCSMLSELLTKLKNIDTFELLENDAI